MKNLISLFFLGCVFITSCSKVVDNNSTVTNPPIVSGVLPTVKFFNVMDYGDVSVQLNTTNIGNVALYYSSTYRVGIVGSNTISLSFGGNTVLTQKVDLVSGNNYSIFIYRVGFNWKISLVNDDLTTPATGRAKVRVLDFRTQAYFDYIKVRILGLGIGQLDFTDRNFLDHESYESYKTFQSIAAGTYNIVVYNSTQNLATKSDYNFANGKIYSVVLMTRADLSAAAALTAIVPDVQVHK